jgi:hypothetical protein
VEVVNLATADLMQKAAPYNPRQIGDHDLEALRRSMRFFGTVEPIVVNRRSDRIVGGHQRVKAALAEGIHELPVVYVDLDEPSERQLNLALNRIHGEWDMEKLEEVLRELETLGADLDLTGFTQLEIDELLKGADEPIDGLTDPDALPEPPDDPKTQPGDLIVLGDHRLLCGDSANADDVARLLGGARIQLVNCDPPYGVNVEPRSNNAIAAGLNTKGNRLDSVDPGSTPTAAYLFSSIPTPFLFPMPSYRASYRFVSGSVGDSASGGVASSLLGGAGRCGDGTV